VIGSIDVLIVVIGRDWLPATDVSGRRPDVSQDLFRHEVEAALRLNVHVIPVLLDGATMPPSQRLPERIRDLGRLQALEIRATRSRSHHAAPASRRVPRSGSGTPTNDVPSASVDVSLNTCPCNVTTTPFKPRISEWFGVSGPGVPSATLEK
jgi:hypothetical protein